MISARQLWRSIPVYPEGDGDSVGQILQERSQFFMSHSTCNRHGTAAMGNIDDIAAAHIFYSCLDVYTKKNSRQYRLLKNISNDQ